MPGMASTPSSRRRTDRIRVVRGDQLDAVRRRRLLPTRITQTLQILFQNRILAPVLSGANADLRAPAIMRLVSPSPWLQGLAARFVGLGVYPEHIASV